MFKNMERAEYLAYRAGNIVEIDAEDLLHVYHEVKDVLEMLEGVEETPRNEDFLCFLYFRVVECKRFLEGKLEALGVDY